MPKAQSIFSLLFLLAFLLSGLRFSEAQTGAPVSGQAVTPTGTPAYNAQLYICAYNSSGVPCFPQVSTYSNPALTGSPLTQPLATNSYGNYNFWVTPGTTVLVQIKINATVIYSYYQAAGGSGGGTGCVPSGTAGFFLYYNGSGCTSGYIDYNVTTPSTLTATASNITDNASSAINLFAGTTLNTASSGKTMFEALGGFEVDDTNSFGIQLNEAGTGPIEIDSLAGGISLDTTGGISLSDASSTGISIDEGSTGPLSLAANRINLTALTYFASGLAPGSGGPDCLQIATTGQITNTGAACGSGAGGSIPVVPVANWQGAQLYTNQQVGVHTLPFAATIPSGCTGSTGFFYSNSLNGTVPTSTSGTVVNWDDVTVPASPVVYCTYTWSASGSTAVVTGAGGTTTAGHTFAYVLPASIDSAGAQNFSLIVSGTTSGGGGGGGSGTVTEVDTGQGLTGGPITTSGTVACNTSTTSVFGCVKPDGTTITAASGVLTAVSQMVYPGAGLANSTGSAWGASYTVGNAGSDIPQLSSGLLNNSVINWAAPSAIGGTTPAAGSFSSLKDTAITGSTQCVHANSSGTLSGTGSDCGSGGGGDTITSPGSTISIGGTPTNTTVDLNLGHANTWTALLTDSAGINLSGSAAPLELAGSAGTTNQCVLSAGAGATPTWGSCSVGGTILFSGISSATNTTATMQVGTGASLLPTGSGTVAANVFYGGALGSVAYQLSSTSTSFIASPTTSGHTFALAWQPSGSAIAPVALDLATYLASPPAIGGTTAAAGSFSSLTDTGISGSSQCVQASSAGLFSGSGVPCGTVTSTGTNGYYALFNGGATALANGHIDDGITTASTITATEKVVAPSFATGTGSPACGSATGCLALKEASTAGTPTAGSEYIRADSVTHQLLYVAGTGSEAGLATVGTPTAGHAACIKSAGPPVVIGYCSTVVDASGNCTCN